MGRPRLTPEEWYERRKLSRKKYYEKNKEKIRKRSRDYYKEHQEAVRIIQKDRYDALQIGNLTHRMTVKEMEKQIEEQKAKKVPYVKIPAPVVENPNKWTKEDQYAYDALYGKNSVPPEIIEQIKRQSK